MFMFLSKPDTFWATTGLFPQELTFGLPSHLNVSAVIMKTAGGKQNSIKIKNINCDILFPVVTKVSIQGSPTGEQYFDITERGMFFEVNANVLHIQYMLCLFLRLRKVES